MKYGGTEYAEASWRIARRRASLAIVCVTACTLLTVGGSSSARAQQGSRLLKPADVMHSQVYLSLEPVPRSRKFEIAVAGAVAPGYHIQASKVLEDYLIPLKLTADLPPGVTLVDTRYPRALLKKFPFAQKPMAVNEGKLTIRLTLEAAPDAPLGPVKVPLTLRYQACNEELCLPPAKIPLVAEFTVAPAGAAVKQIHPEIFSIRD